MLQPGHRNFGPRQLIKRCHGFVVTALDVFDSARLLPVTVLRPDTRVIEPRRDGQRLLDLTELVDRYYAEVQALGGNRWDTSSLIARLERPSRPQDD